MKKKGFTIIELMSIIVILGIIILIAVPVYHGIIGTIRKGTFSKGISGLLKSADIYYADNYGGKIDTGNTEFNCHNNKCVSNDGEELDYDGDLGHGKVTIDEDGNVSLEITDDKYCAYKYANNEKIYVIDGNCDENNIDIVHDMISPTIVQKGISTTPYTITVDYEVSDDIGVKKVVCTYGDSRDKLAKGGNANLSTCLMDNLLSGHEYYYKICSIDIGANESSPCIEGQIRTKAAISGTPTIVASWPDTSSIKVDVSGMNIDESDIVSYRYSVNGEVKQDWTTSSSYTYTGLTEGTSNKILVETKATSGGDLGNIKEADIYTSKTVSTSSAEYYSSSDCNNAKKTVAAQGIYGAVTITPSCSSKTETKTCSTTKSGYSYCSSSSTSTCYIEGVGNVTAKRYDYDSEDVNCEWIDDETCEDVYKGQECPEREYCQSVCEEDFDTHLEACYEDCRVIYDDCVDIYEEECYDSSYESCDTYYTCYYSASKDVTVYTATYSGVAKPSQTSY